MTNISRDGFWLLVDGRELFLSFRSFPWFRQATVQQVLTVELPNPGHLYWPDLDVDLALESIEHPRRFPLVSKVRPSNTMRQTGKVGTDLIRARARRG